jgi:hypothetical protein
MSDACLAGFHQKLQSELRLLWLQHPFMPSCPVQHDPVQGNVMQRDALQQGGFEYCSWFAVCILRYLLLEDGSCWVRAAAKPWHLVCHLLSKCVQVPLPMALA